MPFMPDMIRQRGRRYLYIVSLGGTMEDLGGTLFLILWSLAIIISIGALVYWVNKRLLAHYADQPQRQFQRQMLMLGILLVAVLCIVVLLPIGDAMRGQLLGLLGLLLSATIALSSTSLVGNAMAGIMLRTLQNFRLGDHIEVGEHFGRISEMDLLHTEIQTEDRDLTTLPNLFLVTNPVRVMRSSGTIVSVEVSLGYDIPRHDVEKCLLAGAERAGLEKPFVQVRSLGDFSITYRIAGLQKDLKQLMGVRRRLRACTLDALHDGGVEIVSPTFMNTRAYENTAQFIPDSVEVEQTDQVDVDAIIFDKADQAELLDNMRESKAAAQSRLEQVNETVAKLDEGDAKEAAVREAQILENKILRIDRLLERTESRIEQN